MNNLKKIILTLIISTYSTISFSNNNINQLLDNPDNFRIQAEKAYIEQKYTEAFKWYEHFANLGDGQSSYNVAYMLQHGQGTKKNHKKALKYYKKASKLNFSLADMALANIYLIGQFGIKIDLQQAKYHLEKAFNQGIESAGVELANIYLSENTDTSIQQALTILQALIDANNLDAMYLKAIYDLGLGLKTGNKNILMRGIKSLETLTKQGHIQSMMAVAYMLAYGEILSQNLKMAHNLYSILAENNVPTAKERLIEIERQMIKPFNK